MWNFDRLEFAVLVFGTRHRDWSHSLRWVELYGESRCLGNRSLAIEQRQKWERCGRRIVVVLKDRRWQETRWEMGEKVTAVVERGVLSY